MTLALNTDSMTSEHQEPSKLSSSLGSKPAIELLENVKHTFKPVFSSQELPNSPENTNMHRLKNMNMSFISTHMHSAPLRWAHIATETTLNMVMEDTAAYLLLCYIYPCLLFLR